MEYIPNYEKEDFGDDILTKQELKQLRQELAKKGLNFSNTLSLQQKILDPIFSDELEFIMKKRNPELKLDMTKLEINNLHFLFDNLLGIAELSLIDLNNYTKDPEKLKIIKRQKQMMKKLQDLLNNFYQEIQDSQSNEEISKCYNFYVKKCNIGSKIIEFHCNLFRTESAVIHQYCDDLATLTKKKFEDIKKDGNPIDPIVEIQLKGKLSILEIQKKGYEGIEYGNIDNAISIQNFRHYFNILKFKVNELKKELLILLLLIKKKDDNDKEMKIFDSALNDLG